MRSTASAAGSSSAEATAGAPPPVLGTHERRRPRRRPAARPPARSTRSGRPAAVALERRPRLELGGAAQDQPLAGAGHRHVEQPALLARLGRVPLLAERRVVERRLAPAGARARPAAARSGRRGRPASSRRRHREAAAEVGDAHDLELEPLGAVDRHQPHRVERLALDRRLALARARRAAAAGAARGERRARGTRADRARARPRARAPAASACARSRAGAARPASPASARS